MTEQRRVFGVLIGPRRRKAKPVIGKIGVESHVTHASGRRKTVCTSAVLAFFGIDPGSYRYSQNRSDVIGVLRRNGRSVRSRMSRIPKGISVGGLRTWLRSKKGKGKLERGHYYVSVPGHAIVIDHEGRTVVDTAPVKSDRRRIRGISLVR